MTEFTVEVSTELPVYGVVFDMDGLLMDSESLAVQALVTAGKALNYDTPEEFCRQMIGKSTDICEKLVYDTYGIDFPTDDYFALQEIHLRELIDKGALSLKKGAVELLDFLDAHHIPRAIATSSSRSRTEHHLENVGIKNRFNYIVTRDDVAQGKPNPEPYLTAVKLLNLPGKNVLALEDSHNGVRAAAAAQLRVIMIPDILSPTAEMQQITLDIYDNLSQVIAYISAVNGYDIGD